jgi:hypothetical protein
VVVCSSILEGIFPRKSLCLFLFSSLTSGIGARVRHIVFIHIVAATSAGFCLRFRRLRNFLSRIMSNKFDIPKFDGQISFAIWQIQMKAVLTQLAVQKTLQMRPTDMTDDKW